eukprot:TRINITY_DN9383_c0_g1_i1.p1 TRINITY_DN9383_c0_g1~~TRINITY_DN9383_c0_g1_i1.p1  ORF type:complete len:289 (+),score=38.90 TRINITY_DN9383_c0_g1_i1:73-939(+)
MDFRNKEYDIAHFVLSFLYFVVCFVSLFTLWRLRRAEKLSKRWQSWFHFFLCLGSAVRCGFWALQPFVMEGTVRISDPVNTMLNMMPSFLYFSDYLIILFLWVEIYHNETSQTDVMQMRTVFFVFSILTYVVVVALLVINYVFHNSEYTDYVGVHTLTEKLIMMLDVSLYLSLAFGFLIYGFLIWRRVVVGTPILRQSTKSVLRKIQLITAIVSLCFMVRAGIVIWETFYMPNFSSYWYTDLAYFVGLEFIPLLLMLFVLHREPSRSTNHLQENSPLFRPPPQTWQHR